jgi:HK97 gp10 family phage protein
MTDGVSANFEGADELIAKIKSVSNDMRFKGGRFALRKAGNVVRDRVISEMARYDRSSTPNDISKNVAMRWGSRRFKRTGDLSFRIGIQGGAVTPSETGKTPKKPGPGGYTFYWRFLEYGTENIKARSPIRNAAKAVQRQIVPIFIRQYGRALDRAIKRARKANVPSNI